MRSLLIQKVTLILAAALLTGRPEFLGAQSKSDGSMPQYLFPEFSKCEVRMNNGQVQTPVMNYNTVTESMVFIRGGNYLDLMNPEIVDTIFLNGCKFVSFGKIFYEVLLSGEVDFFIQHKGNLLPAGKPVGYGGTSQVSSSTYMSGIEQGSQYYNLPIPSDFMVKASPVYWIRMNNEMYSFLNEKQLLKIFPDKADKIKEFIRKNRLKFDITEDLIQIVKYATK